MGSLLVYPSTGLVISVIVQRAYVDYYCNCRHTHLNIFSRAHVSANYSTPTSRSISIIFFPQGDQQRLSLSCCRNVVPSPASGITNSAQLHASHRNLVTDHESRNDTLTRKRSNSEHPPKLPNSLRAPVQHGSTSKQRPDISPPSSPHPPKPFNDARRLRQTADASHSGI